MNIKDFCKACRGNYKYIVHDTVDVYDNGIEVDMLLDSIPDLKIDNIWFVVNEDNEQEIHIRLVEEDRNKLKLRLIDGEIERLQKERDALLKEANESKTESV